MPVIGVPFFALEGDLLPVLEAVERDGGLVYVRTGHNPEGLERFTRGAEIPGLGEADQATGSVCGAFLVVAPGTPVTIRPVKLDAGGTNHLVDQLLNPDSVVITPAGLWRGSVLLPGRVATASRSSSAQLLMRRFRRAFSRHFTKLKAYRMGPLALAMLRSGGRLTHSAQSPPEYDLTEVAARPAATSRPPDRAKKKRVARKKTKRAIKKPPAKRSKRR